MMNAEQKARQLSRLYYNEGLDRARIRDLSGAIDKLHTSLQFDKLYIPARNLLGLVYFETGEVVTALSEWVISKNIQPEDNPASDYIDRVRADQNRLNAINQSIRRYNTALVSCRAGDDDAAAVSLRRVIFQNPKLLKAYHLLALIEIKNGQYARARRTLRRAAKIDRTNSMTLRYIKEVDERTGKTTNLDAAEKRRTGADGELVRRSGNQIVRFRETSSFVNLMNILVGLAIGILGVWFVIAPAVRSNVSRDADEKIIEYSNTMAQQEAQIANLNSQIESLNSVVAQQEAEDEEQNNGSSTVNLLKAYQAYVTENYADAGDALSRVTVSELDTDARTIYNSIYDQVMEAAYTAYSNNGAVYFYQEDYASAITALEKAAAIHSDDYDNLDILGLSYQYTGNYEKALEMFNRIIELFPGTRRADNAQYSIMLIEQAQGSSGTSSTEDATSGTADADSGADETGAETSTETTADTTETGTDTEGADVTGN